MTLRESVTRELLAAVDDPDELDEIFQRYNRSKGPLYLGLAAATTELHDQFETVSQDFRDLAAEKDELTEEVAALREQQIEMEQSFETLSTELQTVGKGLEQASGSVASLDKLERKGFGEAELGRLSEILAHISAENGGLPEEGAAGFFKFVERFESIISFELESTRAQSKAAQARSEVERWQAEATVREVQSRARTSTIDLLEELLSHGVKDDDIIRWAAIISQPGVTVDELAGALEEFSSIEALSSARQARSEELQAEISALEAQVQALGQERDDAHQAITAVKERALGEVKSAEKQARKHISTMFREATEFGDLKKEATDLGELVDAARDLRSGNLDKWRYLPREVIQHTLAGSIRWAEGDGRNIPVPAPGVVTQANSLLSYSHLNLRQILLWALSGVLTEEQKNG